MSSRHGIVAILLAWIAAPGFSAASSSLVTEQRASEKPRARISEYQLRSRAIKRVQPTLPANSPLLSTASVAVAEVQLDASGHVIAVKILEAADREIAESMKKSLAHLVGRAVRN